MQQNQFMWTESAQVTFKNKPYDHYYIVLQLPSFHEPSEIETDSYDHNYLYVDCTFITALAQITRYVLRIAWFLAPPAE